ncbi:MAG TPA: NADH-quinone oxidoreductase subunit NuoH [Candidatus Acidoferrales bacterium]|nr:NADH-quinone oxidoreductase subunit NuoH [Candidatus Acidoferrales bacterium]
MNEALIVAVESLALVLIVFTVAAYAILAERRIIARMQARIGPDRVGPQGFFQPLADVLKLLTKEDIRPVAADRVLHYLTPIVTLVPVLLVFAVIPASPGIHLTDINIGYLYVTAVSSIAVYGVALGGWSSNSKYALLGGLRSSAQLISYELAQGLAALGVVAAAGSLSLVSIVGAQFPIPFAVTQPLGLAVYLVASIAESSRAPFDLPEAEQELGAGYHTEYSSFRFALFMLSEYVHVIVSSALVATLFLGGWWPFAGGILGVAAFALKMAVLIFVFIWLRATLPRVRYDRLMAFGWKVLIPLALLQLAVVAAWVALT